MPPQLRAKGAQTVYFDLYLNNRVGTPSKPADPAAIQARADKLFDTAVTSSGCDHPLIAENELFGAQLPTPWTPTTAQYRANVLAFLQRLAERGARPFLLLSNRPYTHDPDRGRVVAGRRRRSRTSSRRSTSRGPRSRSRARSSAAAGCARRCARAWRT